MVLVFGRLLFNALVGASCMGIVQKAAPSGTAPAPHNGRSLFLPDAYLARFLPPPHPPINPQNETSSPGREQEALALQAGFSAAQHYEIAFGLMGVLVATV